MLVSQGDAELHEEVRRTLLKVVNSEEFVPEGQTWTTEELERAFEVEGFLAPFVVVRRKADNVRGVLMFRHQPRIYFGFEET